jgi:hypothetical protein
MNVAHYARGDVFSCHLLRFVLSFAELMSRSEKARRNFQPVPTFSVGISLSEWLGALLILSK